MPILSSGERLKDIILSNRMTKKEFSAALGYNPSYITQICLNNKPPSLEFAQKVEKCFGVPVEWLMYGSELTAQTSQYSSPLKQAVQYKISHIESDEKLQAIMAFMNCYDELPKISAMNSKSSKPVTFNKEPKLYKVPLKGEVAGGSPIIAYESSEETLESPIFADSVLYLKGKSMEPTYPDGCKLLIKENAYVGNGDVVIALIMREAEVAEATCKIINKKRGKVTLSPINAAFPVQDYFEKDGVEIKIFGKVIGTLS